MKALIRTVAVVNIAAAVAAVASGWIWAGAPRSGEALIWCLALHVEAVGLVALGLVIWKAAND